MKELNYVHNKTRDKLHSYRKESHCGIFRLKSERVEVLSTSGREFHNLVKKNARRKLLLLDKEETEYNYRVN